MSRIGGDSCEKAITAKSIALTKARDIAYIAWRRDTEPARKLWRFAVARAEGDKQLEAVASRHYEETIQHSTIRYTAALLSAEAVYSEAEIQIFAEALSN